MSKMLDFEKIGKKNICIVGLMGSGKSVIGRELSKFYNIKFYDTDYEIEKKTGKSISNLFQTKGEKYFREIEEDLCSKILNIKDCIISIGGGSINSQKTRQKLSLNSYSIYLKVNLNVLIKRLENSYKRPLLVNENKLEVLKKLFKSRKGYYESSSLIINNNHDKDKILKDIKNKMQKYVKENNI